MMNNLVPIFHKSLCTNEILDLSKEYLELGIDKILDNDIIKDIPIVNTLSSIIKAGFALRERHLLKQTLQFMFDFHNYSVSTEKIEQYRNKIQNDQELLNEELGRVLFLLDRYIESQKAGFLGKFYAAYVDEKIKWNIFCELSDIVDRIFVSDIEILKTIFNNGAVYSNENIYYKHERLFSIGLLKNTNRVGNGAYIASDDETVDLMKLSDIGEVFCEIIFQSQ